MCVLFVTAIRIKDLLFLKVYQLQPLITEYSILIEDFKQNTNSYKAVLTEKSKKIIQIRKKNFIALFYKKTPNSYVFTSEFRPDKMLRRETISRDINHRIKSISTQLPDKISITTHSFRVGDITQLWEDSRDIEFVRHSIYRQRLDITSRYVSNLSD